MKKDLNELMTDIKNVIGDRTDEPVITLLENVKDTFENINISQEEMIPKSELERIENEWSKKYRDRFFEVDDGNNQPPPVDKTKNKNNLTYENLFKGC